MALENQHHPIRDYLDSLQWDGIPRVDSLLPRYYGAEDTELNRAFGKLTLVGAVRRVRQPGVKFDTAPILEGRQGSGKSTSLEILAGPGNWSDQDILGLDGKSQMELLEGVWIYELSELEGMKKADATTVKSFLSRNEDRGRPAYARFKENWKRQGVFIGTTNDDKYLRDTTGNRRFWPVKTGIVDLVALASDRDQLWAEASVLEAKGISLVLPEHLWKDAQIEQEARVEEDPWSQIVMSVTGAFVGGFERVGTSDILDTNFQIPPVAQTQYHLKRLAPLMRAAGWDGPKSLKLGHNRVVRGYERPRK